MMQNSRHAEDLRVRRTRKLLQQALVELTVEHGYAAVTVQAIAERAMVNRATFYRHYLDKDDLLEQYMNEVYELTASQAAVPVAQAHEGASAAAPEGLISLLDHLHRHADFYRVMLGKQGDAAFVQRMQQYIERRFHAILPGEGVGTQASTVPFDLCLRYVAHAGVGAIGWWLSDGMSYSPEQIAVWLNRLSKTTIDLAIGQTTA